MRFLILVNNYPVEQPVYAERFVHARVSEYIKTHECLVASFKVPSDYIFEGVQVVRLQNEAHFYTILNEYRPDRILVHFALKRIIRMLQPVDKKIIVWVHGYEALGWYRRWFELKNTGIFSSGFVRKVISNMSQQYTLRRFIQRSNHTPSIVFVFVSRWMCRMTESDTFSRILYKKIIPNPIDDRCFTYSPKPDDHRFHILIIRPFTSSKYALDMVRDTILGLSNEPGFEKLKFTIYGQGPDWERITAAFKPFNNIRLHNHLMNKTALAEVFFNHGIFLCPTRQDAQGVTMCEAMSCGLVPITSANTGIPEFVQDGYSGYTTTSVNEMILRIKQLVARADLFQTLSGQAAQSIRKKAGIADIINSELSLIMS
ncbi:MAG: glycosyltransferase family 4 protein [Saprospiraceae bacterium]|nr:glycosyltransferase family 4 protein [Saprospiraceae bacterium]